MVKWYSNYKIHLLVWLVYMLYEILSLGILFDNFRSPVIYLFHYLVVVFLFYFHANITLPNATKNKKFAPYLVVFVILVELTIYVLAQYTVRLFLDAIKITAQPIKAFDVAFVMRNVYRGVLFMGFSTGFYFLRNYLAERKKTAALEKDRLEKIIQQQKTAQELVLAENAFLKAQIKPHFLFNTLDFIYHKVNPHSAVAGDAIVKLAEMMRFAIHTEETGHHLQLANEIEQVENLVYLYQMRKNTPLNVHFSYEPAVKELHLIPLVLLTLMENIFKHANLSHADDVAYLELKIDKDQLHIHTANLIEIKAHQRSEKSGLKNIQKRLTYAYGDEVSFSHQTNHTHFSLQIEIPIALLKGPF